MSYLYGIVGALAVLSLVLYGVLFALQAKNRANEKRKRQMKAMREAVDAQIEARRQFIPNSISPD